MTGRPRTVFTPGSITGIVHAHKRHACDSHLTRERHYIEPGQMYVANALPPHNPDVGNAGWLHQRVCLDCCPAEHDLRPTTTETAEELDLADTTPAEAELAEALAARMAGEATDLRRMAPAANGICHRCGSGLLDATGDHIRNDGCTSVPDQPDGIDETTNTVPDPARAAGRVNAWLCEWGDGLIDVTAGTPLYARDLAVLADMSKAGRDAARRDGAADALLWAADEAGAPYGGAQDGDLDSTDLRRMAAQVRDGEVAIPTTIETTEEEDDA